MRSLVVALCVVALGCVDGNFSARAGQAEAVALVWMDMYGMTVEELPAIEWVRTNGWGEPNIIGTTLAGWKIILASGARGDWPLYDTGLAHELMHFRTWIQTGDVDPLHFRGDWALANDAASAVTLVVARL